MNRREFMQQAALAGAALPFATEVVRAKGVKWEIGCFNRPWTKWGYDVTLREIKAAGYSVTGLLSATREEPFLNTGRPGTPADYLPTLRKRLLTSGLKANMGALRSRHNIPIEESVKEMRLQVDAAHDLSLKYILSFGVDKAEEYDHYYKVMRETAAYAQERGIRLAMKPHGGGSSASAEIVAAIKTVGHKNFSIWYDAGNIIHYTGKDPIEELKPIVQYVSGFCAKDCAQLKGDVMLQFGTGKVDFAGVFKTLKAGGFKGPVMVECCKIGETAEETTTNARANREFLEKLLAQI
ncbi:MAG: sugar phosphate isomerase/epimerase family protein [Blastocatellia bacterium]|jgi:sugar phosphate isomerase/epimerase